jgi:hypothetical protein
MKVKFTHIRADLPHSTTHDISSLVRVVNHALRAGQIKEYGKLRDYGCYASYSPNVKAAVICHVTDEDTGCRATGFSFCSYLDNFATKRGRRIALGRARKALAAKRRLWNLRVMAHAVDAELGVTL